MTLKFGEPDDNSGGRPGRLRVVVETESSFDTADGLGVYASELLSALQALQGPDLEIVPLRSPARRTHKHYLLERLSFDQIQVPWKACQARADLLHRTFGSSPLLMPCPTVLTVHDLIPSVRPQGWPWRARLYHDFWMRFSMRRATAIIAISESTRQDISRLTSVAPERIEVIPEGVSGEFRPVESNGHVEQVLDKHSLRQPYILAVGALDHRKNVPMLLEAFSLCRRRGVLSSRHSLAIVGPQNPETLRCYAQQAERLEAEARVVGRVSREDLVALYQGAELFVFPSAYEGFGLPPLEAMACGTPVIASAVTSIPEVVGDAAVLVSPPLTAERFADAMAVLASDPQARRELSCKGKARAALFSWSNTARRTLEVYRRVAAAAG
ncbi:MAG: glycosyltransferase family 4 protein [Candidatus Wallbacteria bacterium]|nr:glycosyltransferase family 4 protein [Candidatus Wallbacteria bacterium]